MEHGELYGWLIALVSVIAMAGDPVALGQRLRRGLLNLGLPNVIPDTWKTRFVLGLIAYMILAGLLYFMIDWVFE